MAVQTPEAAATEICEPMCTALGTCTSQSFSSQNKQLPEVYLAFQIAYIGIIAEGKKSSEVSKLVECFMVEKP